MYSICTSNTEYPCHPPSCCLPQVCVRCNRWIRPLTGPWTQLCDSRSKTIRIEIVSYLYNQTTEVSLVDKRYKFFFLICALIIWNLLKYGFINGNILNINKKIPQIYISENKNLQTAENIPDFMQLKFQIKMKKYEKVFRDI